MTAPSAAGRPIRVAHVIQNLNYGGMERVMNDLVRRLPRPEFELHVVVLEYYGRFAEGLAAHATLHQVPPMSRLSLLRPAALAAVFRQAAPDVVHSHSGIWLKAVRAARSARVPVVVHTEHGRADPDPLVARLVDHLASRGTDTVIAVSESVAALLRRRVVARGTPIEVIINGVDTERFRPRGGRESLRPGLGIPDGDFVIGSIGRLEPIKHYRLAVQAFARVLARRREAGIPAPWLVLAGDGSERAALEAEAGALGVAERVRFLGWRDDVERLHDTFDLFTLTSRSEGTSISLLEAMSAGLCCAVTDVGGNRAVLGEPLAALLVPPDDPEAMAEAWHQRLARPGETRRLGEACRARVAAAFGVDRMVARHAQLYRELARHAV